jgi:hypothetical protein
VRVRATVTEPSAVTVSRNSRAGRVALQKRELELQLFLKFWEVNK